MKIPSLDEHKKSDQRGFTKYNLRVINKKKNPALKCTIEMEFKCIEEDLIEEPLIVRGRWNGDAEPESLDDIALLLEEDIFRNQPKDFCAVLKLNNQSAFYGYDFEAQIPGFDLNKWLCVNNEYQVNITLRFSDIMNIFRFRLSNHGTAMDGIEIMGPY